MYLGGLQFFPMELVGGCRKDKVCLNPETDCSSSMYTVVYRL